MAIFIEPPFAYLENNQLKGENIEIAKLLANSINLSLEFIQCPFIRCLAMVKNGQADMIFGLKKTKNRAQKVTFLEPAYLIQTVPLFFYTLKSSNIAINSFEDLHKLSVGILRGGTYFDRFDHDSKINKVELTSREQLVKMLLRGRIDAILERDESVVPIVSKDDYQKLTPAAYQYNKTVKGYIGVSKQSAIKQYAKQLSVNLKKLIDDGELAKITAKRNHYFKNYHQNH